MPDFLHFVLVLVFVENLLRIFERVARPVGCFQPFT